jgi:hypothetical protein
VDLDPLLALALAPFIALAAGLAIGLAVGFAKLDNPLARELRRALKRDGALGVIIRRDGTAVIRAVDLDGDYVVDEKGQRLWEVKRMKVVKKGSQGETVLVEGADKPVILSMSRTRVPLYILHEDNCQAPSNPSMILIDPDAIISPISAKALYNVKREAEILGMLKERNKLRDAMFYVTIFVGMAIAAVIVLGALKMAFGGG